MRQLPGTGYREDHELDQSPADDTRISSFGLITEFGFSFLERVINCQSSYREEKNGREICKKIVNTPAETPVPDEYPATVH